MSSLKIKHIFVTAEKSRASKKLVKKLAQLDGIVEATKPLPPTYDIVKKFFKSEKDYYKEIFDYEFSKHTDNTNYVLFHTSSKPDKILDHFPNSVVINFTQDPDEVSKDILEDCITNQVTTDFEYLVPQENEYLKFLNILKDQKNDLTKADVWAYEHKKKFWQDKYTDQFLKNIKNKVTSNMFYRKTIDDPKVIKVNSRTNVNLFTKKLQDKIK